MNIVFGGSFNPPTKAHLEIVLKLNKTFKPTNIIILPVGKTYSWKNELVHFNLRYQMIEKTFENVKNLSISKIEKDNFEGTLKSLMVLSEKYDNIYFVLGADNLEKFHEWINYETLLKKYGFIIITRTNYHLDLSLFKKFKTKYEIINFESDISSSKIRNNLLKYKDDLPENIYEFITQNKLYQGEK